MHSKTAPRRRHSNELKASVLAECEQPGTSVAAVAQAHGLNANLVHKWRRERNAAAAMPVASNAPDAQCQTFVPLQLPPPIAAAPDIRIEVRRAATVVNIAWPASEAGACAAWLREWLR